MRLLICTQAVDRDDPFLGFFHGWIEELAKQCEAVEVVCLKRSKHDLPENVHVHSLGKENGRSRMKYLWRFFQYIWTLRREYDAVFVHMNQEYVLLGGPLWSILKKRVFMWRNHYAGSWFTDLAVRFCTKVFCTSKHSYTARFGKTALMPVGVDTDRFRPDAALSRTLRSILSLGRVAPSKNVDMLIEALGLLRARGVEFSATICGSDEGNEAYAADLKRRAAQLSIADSLVWKDGVAHDETPPLYASHEIFVNLSRSGMYDKTLFEAAASGCLVLASSGDFAEHVDPRCVFAEGDTSDLASKLSTLLSLSADERGRIVEELRTFAVANGLQAWGTRVVSEMII